jgi:hypothetical protein
LGSIKQVGPRSFNPGKDSTVWKVKSWWTNHLKDKKVQPLLLLKKETEG